MDAGDDWRAQVLPATRSRVVHRILQTLRMCLPVAALVELQRIAVRFEAKVYDIATSRREYLHKIALKLISMESRTNTQQNAGPANNVWWRTLPAGSSSKGKKQKKLRCHFCKKGGHFKKDCLKRKIWFEEKGVAYDPTHKWTKAHENKNEGAVLKEPGLAE